MAFVTTGLTDGFIKELICIIALLVTLRAAWVYKARADKASASQGRIPLTVKVRQLPIDESTNLTPVEILSASAVSNGKNGIEEFSCVTRNNTNRGLSAIVLAITVLLEEGGEERSVTSMLTNDTLVHPDIREERGGRDIQPGFTYEGRLDGSTFKEGASVKGVSVEVMYALFADGAQVGYDPRGEGLASIRDTREGAFRYKE